VQDFLVDLERVMEVLVWMHKREGLEATGNFIFTIHDTDGVTNMALITN
jgi:hypothetical protein